jgi:hypothetical protein
VKRTSREKEAGMALFLAIAAVIAFVGMSMGMITSSLSTNKEYAASQDRVQRLYVAEAGISYALADLAGGGSGNLGTMESPVSFGSGAYVVNTVKKKDGTVTVTSLGSVRGESRAVRTVFQTTGGVFHSAVFAGNSSGDPTYSLDLAGEDEQADEIGGDIFSGGSLVIDEDAKVSGKPRAKGKIKGGEGEEGLTQQPPNLSALDFEHNHDVNVAAEFAAHSVYQSNAQGGSAWQVGESLPSHILRLNASDRKTENLSTEKDDYYLEDPYESPGGSSAPTHISLSVSDGETGTDGNAKVYFIDGNLWLHNRRTLEFTFDHLSGGTRVTFVVKGNIYFSDDLILEKSGEDGIAFIALTDEKVADSGNIYFGDPAFGTLLRMYAENNFYDNNLGADGSKAVEINGIMSAGNQVAINRDFGDHHTKLKLDFDDRVKTGDLELPGLPNFEEESAAPTRVTEVSSFEIAVVEGVKAVTGVTADEEEADEEEDD